MLQSYTQHTERTYMLTKKFEKYYLKSQTWRPRDQTVIKVSKYVRTEKKVRKMYYQYFDIDSILRKLPEKC